MSKSEIGSQYFTVSKNNNLKVHLPSVSAFYAYFLKHTNLNHPGKEEIISTQECKWAKIVKKITGPVPQNKSIWYHI